MPAWMTGVSAHFDYAATVKLARTLVPAAKRAYLVAGNSPYDQQLLDLALRQLEPLRQQIELRYIVGASRQEMVERMAEMDAESIVIYISVLRDGKGNVSGPERSSLLQLVQRSRAP